jgi:1,4-alpha-glucan branching enzyme
MAALETVAKMKEFVSRQQASGMMQEVEFTLYAPAAKKVCIAGKFNAWDTKSLPMKKGKDGTWRIKVKLPSGQYEYKYFVDGTWASDISGAETVPNSFGTCNCVIAVE